MSLKDRIGFSMRQGRLARYRSALAPRRRLYQLLGVVLPEDYGKEPWRAPTHDEWAYDSVRGRFRGYPDQWRVHGHVDITEPQPIAVLVHCYFADLLDEILEQLAAIPVRFDLIITNSSGVELTVDPAQLPNAGAIRVLDIENRGRDIWPTVAAVNSGVLDPYLLILKIHTKKSVWRADHAELAGSGDEWRRDLYGQLLGSRENVEHILSAFASNPDLGSVTADGSVLGPEFWGDNESRTAELARRLEVTFELDDLRFCAGSVYWCRGIVLQGLRAMMLTEADFDPEAGQDNATTAHALERLIGVLHRSAGLSIRERAELPASGVPESWRRYGDGKPEPTTRIIPFYLPQFHPFEENSRWWGDGFTEWANVSTAQPLYPGHHQPKLPADLGFYDLRVDEVRSKQVELAKRAGIEGFMYYYYWFAGKRLMGLPIEAMRTSSLDLPYCVMWANENWSRRWDGSDDDVLIAQDYDQVPASAFIDDVLEFLADDRYLTIDGRKVVAVYRPAVVTDLQSTLEHWRRVVREHGLGELCILGVDVSARFGGLGFDTRTAGLDGSLAFPPHNMHYEHINRFEVGMLPHFSGHVLDYRAMASAAIMQARRDANPSHFPGAMVTFDNTARRTWNPDLWWGSNPYEFRRWLAGLASSLRTRDQQHRIVFVNAWNEWAEGAVLEPTVRHGRSYLAAVQDVAHG